MDETRLARIRLLSSRFNQLQGLRVAAAGALLAIVMAVYVVVRPAPYNEGALVALLVWLPLAAQSEWWLRGYYTRTFGRQVSRPKSPRQTAVLVLMYFAIAWYLNWRFPAIPSGAPTAFGVVLGSVWVAVRDWPWRAYYLGATAAVAIALGLSAAVGGALDPSLTLAAMFFAIGTAMVPIGLLDHRLLVQLTDEAREASAPSDPVACSPPDRG
jgi:hypothetical protein